MSAGMTSRDQVKEKAAAAGGMAKKEKEIDLKHDYKSYLGTYMDGWEGGS